MNRLMIVAAALTMSAGMAHAQAANKMDDSKTAPGTTGAMGNVNANGVATDPGGVQQQSGGNTKASPGTVGAAPAADTPSQIPKKK